MGALAFGKLAALNFEVIIDELMSGLMFQFSSVDANFGTRDTVSFLRTLGNQSCFRNGSSSQRSSFVAPIRTAKVFSLLSICAKHVKGRNQLLEPLSKMF